MKINIEAPEIASCEVRDCAYNREQLCHARAITVGDGTTPNCDTFFPGAVHTAGSQRAGVGACKVVICKYNQDLECQADGINVRYAKRQAFCSTFQPR